MQFPGAACGDPSTTSCRDFQEIVLPQLAGTSCNKRCFFLLPHDNSSSLVSVCTGTNTILRMPARVSRRSRSPPFSVNEVQAGVVAALRSRGCRLHLLQASKWQKCGRAHIESSRKLPMASAHLQHQRLRLFSRVEKKKSTLSTAVLPERRNVHLLLLFTLQSFLLFFLLLPSELFSAEWFDSFRYHLICCACMSHYRQMQFAPEEAQDGVCSVF